MKLEFCDRDSDMAFTVDWPSSSPLPRVGEYVEFDSVGCVIPSFQVDEIKHSINTDGVIEVFVYINLNRPMTAKGESLLREHPLVDRKG